MSGRPIRGFFAGLFIGIGVALLLIIFAVIALGTLTPYVIIVVGAVIGVLLGMFADRLPGRGGGSRSTVASGAGPAPGAGAPPA
jgi:uncharacterized membrane protein SpoIIM required for sporulation